MAIKVKNGVLYVNVSVGKANFGQRNNEIDWHNKNAKINKNTTCNVTSMVMGLSYMGYVFPKDCKYSQPEDALANFIIKSSKVDNYYKEHMPVMYKDYKKGAKDCYTPNEVHQVLAEATNMWLGCSAVNFSTERKISDIIKELLHDRPVIISGKFCGLNHIVCLVGAKFRVSSDNVESAVDEIIRNNLKPASWVIDDPWGNLHEPNYKSGGSGSGNDIEISNDYFNKCVKPLGNTLSKWSHFLKESAAII